MDELRQVWTIEPRTVLPIATVVGNMLDGPITECSLLTMAVYLFELAEEYEAKLWKRSKPKTCIPVEEGEIQVKFHVIFPNRRRLNEFIAESLDMFS